MDVLVTIWLFTAPDLATGTEKHVLTIFFQALTEADRVDPVKEMRTTSFKPFSINVRESCGMTDEVANKMSEI